MIASELEDQNLPSLAPPVRLSVTRSGPIPTVAWIPDGEVNAVALVCHGGSGHKESLAVTSLARVLLPVGVAVVAIDGPVHGERRDDGNLDPVFCKAAFRAAWRAGVGVMDIAHDFSAVIDHLQTVPKLASLPIGYIGVSMGTAYGIPLLAQESRIQVAVIGLWSTTFQASEHLAEFARRIRCPVWFTQQWDDEFHERPGTAELFDVIGSEDKRLVAYAGTHRELEGERLQDAVAFFTQRLERRS